MRILLVQPASNIMKNRKESKPPFMPLGLMYIAGTLLANGYKDVEILDVMCEGFFNETSFKKDYIRFGLSPKEIKRRIKEFNPDVVGVSCMASIRKYHAYEICKLAKEVNPYITTVIGGNHVTCFPQEALRRRSVDYVILGEGEEPFLKLVQALENNTSLCFDGLASKNGGYILNPQKCWRRDIDNIPFPAHHLLNLDMYLDLWKKTGYHYYEAKKFTMMVMARGCPNLCEHCPHDVLFPGYRARSAKNVFDEIKLVHETLGVEEVQFHEYNGMVIWKTVEEFCNLMIESGLNKKITWGWPIGIWLKHLTFEKLKLMREAGMAYVDLAIESANQELLDSLMKGKDVSLEHTMDVIKWSNELDYYINCFFMLGLEGQTKADIEKTIEFAQSLNVDSVTFFIAQPLPGTPFWNHCKEKGLFLDDFDTFKLRYGKSNIKIEGVSAEELEMYRYKGRKDFLKHKICSGRTVYNGKRGENYLK